MNDLIKNQYGPTFFKRWGKMFGAVFITLRSALGISVFISVMASLPGRGLASEGSLIEWSSFYYYGERFPDASSAAKYFCENFLNEIKAGEMRIKSCTAEPITQNPYGENDHEFGSTVEYEFETYVSSVGKWISLGVVPMPLVGYCRTCFFVSLPNYVPSSLPSRCENRAKGAQIYEENVPFGGQTTSFSFAPTSSQKTDKLTFNASESFVDQSTGSLTKLAACYEGFDELQMRGSAPWLNDLYVVYSDSCGCQLKDENDRVVGELPIIDRMNQDPKTPKIDAIKLVSANGDTTHFYKQSCGGDHKYHPLGETRVSLSDSQQGTSKIWTLTADSGNKIFNANGDLISISDDQDRLFSYNIVDGQLNSIEAPGGTKLTFNYTDGRLTGITKPDNTTRTYLYEDNRFPNTLTGTLDEKGVKNNAWQLDEKGRVVESELAGGANKTTTTFHDDGSSTTTNQLGKKTTYKFTTVAGARHISQVIGEPTINCLGANKAYSYTPQAQLETQTDWNGSITKYQYDSRNREISRTKAYGTALQTTVNTCWEGTSTTQPARIIEPTRVTLLSYDNGLLKSKIVKPRPAGLVDCTTSL